MGLNIKTKRDGIMMRGPRGEIWMSPERDLAFAFPNYIKKALYLFEHDTADVTLNAFKEKNGEEGANDKMGKVAVAMAQFLIQIESVEDVGELWNNCGIKDCDLEARLLFEHLLHRVIISAFFLGISSAKEGRPVEFIYGDGHSILEFVDGYEPEQSDTK